MKRTNLSRRCAKALAAGGWIAGNAVARVEVIIAEDTACDAMLAELRRVAESGVLAPYADLRDNVARVLAQVEGR